MKVLMIGVSRKTKGGMWTVVENYLSDKNFVKSCKLKYIPSATCGNAIKRALFSTMAILRIFIYNLFHKYDVLHVHMSERASVSRKGVVISISKALRHPKVIIHMHGAEFEQWYKNLSRRKQDKVLKIINRADKIIILGEYWRDFIGSLLIDSGKIHVIHNGVAVPENNPYNKQAKNILFLGEIGKRKGIYILLNAIQQINGRMENFKVILCGNDTTPGINEEIEKRNLTARVVYYGFLDNDHRKQVFKETAINVLPSFNEGLPMTVLETMAFGIPNIATNVAAIPEVVNAKNGALIEPNDKKALASTILKMLTDDNLRLAQSEKAYSTIRQNFSIRTHNHSILNIYKEVLHV